MFVLVFVFSPMIGTGSSFNNSAAAAINTISSSSAQLTSGPVIQADLQEIAWTSYADYTAQTLSVTYLIKNVGNEPALDCTIISSNASNNVQTLTQLPTNMGSIDSGGVRSETIKYIVPTNVQRFKINNTMSYMDILQRQHFYPAIPSPPTPPATLNVRDYGATGDGVTDDTAAIQTAINAMPTSTVLYIPAGEYIVGNLVGHSDMTVRGDGWGSILKTKVSTADTADKRYDGFKFEGTTTDTSGNLANIHFEDIQLLGQCDTGVFVEHQALIKLRGVSEATFDNVLFKGPQGDGMYLAGEVGEYQRHNVNIRVTNSTFDGINRNNRNGISIIDGNGVIIENNTFTNLTRGDMPGPIDVEPNKDYSIVKNITVGSNYFYNNDGTTISVNIGPILATKLANIVISDNTIFDSNNYRTILVKTNETDVESLEPMGIQITGNHIEPNPHNTVTFPFHLKYLRGVEVSGNTVIGGGLSYFGEVGISALSIKDVKILNNTFEAGGNNAYGVFIIGSIDDLEINGNTFKEPYGGIGVSALTFLGWEVTTVSHRVAITNNIFITGANQNYSIKVNSHSLDTAHNSYSGNTVVGRELVNQFTFG